MGRRSIWGLVFACLAVALAPAGPALAGGGCHSDNRTDEAGVRVGLADNCFGPTVLRVAVGDTVEWINKDGVTHTVTAAGGVFDQMMEPSAHFKWTFAEAGVYPYYCMIHPRMAGAVVVGSDAVPVAQVAQPVAAAPPAPVEKKTSNGALMVATALLMGSVGFGIGRFRSRRTEA